MSECDYDYLHSSISILDKCEFVRENCSGEFFNLLSLHYCHIQSYPIITLILAILILLLCFSFLSSTGNEYLANILGILSEKLKMSQNLAGLTLLALGNQAPDIAVAIIAGGDADEGIEASLSSLLGGGFIVVGLVLSTVIFLGNGVSVLSYNYIRDLGVYLIGLSVLVVIGYQGKFHFWECLLQLCLYVVYVVVCFFMDKYLNTGGGGDEKNESEGNGNLTEGLLDDSKEYDVRLFNTESYEKKINEENNNENNENKNNENNNENNISSINDDNKVNNENNNVNNENNNINDNNNENNNIILKNTNDDNIFIQRNINKKTVSGFRKKPTKFNIDDVISKYFYHQKSVSKIKSQKHKKQSTDKNQLQMYSKFRYDLIKYYLTSFKNKEFDKKTLFEKILFILIERPFNLVRDLTIPPFEQEKWNRQFFILLPINLSIFLTIILHLYSYFWYTIPFIITWYFLMFIISIFFFRISYRGSLPKQEWLLLILALIVSILWIYSVTNILMDMIAVIRILLPVKLSESFLTMTVLAFGNSLPDFIVNCSLAKNGYAEMALSGSIGAPAFGLLFGFGMSLIRKSMQNNFGAFEFDLFGRSKDKGMNVDNWIIVSAIGNLYVLLIVYVIFGIVQRFNLTRLVSLFGYSIYIIYFGFIVYFAFIWE